MTQKHFKSCLLQDKVQAKQATEEIIQAVKQYSLQRFVEFSSRNSYKIPVTAFPMFPDTVATMLKSMKKHSTTFGGKRGQKVRFFAYIF